MIFNPLTLNLSAKGSSTSPFEFPQVVSEVEPPTPLSLPKGEVTTSMNSSVSNVRNSLPDNCLKEK